MGSTLFVNDRLVSCFVIKKYEALVLTLITLARKLPMRPVKGKMHLLAQFIQISPACGGLKGKDKGGLVRGARAPK